MENNEKELIAVRKTHYDKDTFARHIVDNKFFPRPVYASSEPIDNAIAKAKKATPNRVYYDRFFDEKNQSATIITQNTGEPVDSKTQQNFGFPQKESEENVFGTGLKNVSSYMGGNCSLMSLDKDGRIHEYDYTNWTESIPESILHSEEDKARWNPYPDRNITTTFSMTTTKPDVIDGLKKITASTFGAFYWAYLKDPFNELYFDGKRVYPVDIPGNQVNKGKEREILRIKSPVTGKIIDVVANVYEFDLSKVETETQNPFITSIAQSIKKCCKLSNCDLSDSEVKYFLKNIEWQGIFIYLNGRATEHVGVSIIKQLKNKKKYLSAHNVFNSRITIVDIQNNQENRDVDLPFKSNNKATIDFESPLGQQYANEIDRLVGDAYRKLNYDAIELRARIIFENWSKTIIESGGIDDYTYEKNVSLSNFGNINGQIDFVIGKKKLNEDGSFATRPIKVFNEDGSEEIVECEYIDYKQITGVYEFTSPNSKISSDDIDRLRRKVKFVTLHNLDNRLPAATVVCASDNCDKDDIIDTKELFEREMTLLVSQIESKNDKQSGSKQKKKEEKKKPYLNLLYWDKILDNE